MGFAIWAIRPPSGAPTGERIQECSVLVACYHACRQSWSIACKDDTLEHRYPAIPERHDLDRVGHRRAPSQPNRAPRRRRMSRAGTCRAPVASCDHVRRLRCAVKAQEDSDVSGHPQILLITEYTTPRFVCLNIISPAWSTFDRPRSWWTHREQPGRARRNRAGFYVVYSRKWYHSDIDRTTPIC